MNKKKLKLSAILGFTSLAVGLSVSPITLGTICTTVPATSTYINVLTNVDPSTALILAKNCWTQSGCQVNAIYSGCLTRSNPKSQVNIPSYSAGASCQFVAPTKPPVQTMPGKTISQADWDKCTTALCLAPQGCDMPVGNCKVSDADKNTINKNQAARKSCWQTLLTAPIARPTAQATTDNIARSCSTKFCKHAGVYNSEAECGSSQQYQQYLDCYQQSAQTHHCVGLACLFP
jgi:hypothetical protein